MLFSETLASMQRLNTAWRAVIGEELRGLETTFVGPAPAGEVRIERRGSTGAIGC